MEAFKDYAYYYNMLYENKDYKGEAQIVNQFLKKYTVNKKNSSILNIGCGTGRHDIELAKLGYQMTGIDLSDEMIAIAKKNKPQNCKLEYEVGDARTYRTPNQFESVISLFHVMSYQNTNEDIIQSFQTASEALTEGGIFLFDVWYGPGVLTDRPVVRVKEMEDETNKIIRIANPILYANKNIVDVNYQVLIFNKTTNITQEIKETHSMRYYFEPEIKSYLQLAGMELIDSLDCNTLKTPTFDTWTTYFAAKKHTDKK